MELSTLLVLLIALFVMFFFVMRVITKARVWNIFAVVSIMALIPIFIENITFILGLVTVMLWAVYDTFFTQ